MGSVLFILFLVVVTLVIASSIRGEKQAVEDSLSHWYQSLEGLNLPRGSSTSRSPNS